MNTKTMKGYKLFKELDDGTIHIVRITNLKELHAQKNVSKDKIEIYDYLTKETRETTIGALKGYTPLEPDAIFTISIGSVKDENGKSFKDVICTITNYLMVKAKISGVPFAICRQNITDIFANLYSTKIDPDIVGLAVNQNDCPANFDYSLMLATSSISDYDFINFYKTDTIDDILNMIDQPTYDAVLKDLYKDHVEHERNPSLLFKKSHKGWCSSLELLLKENNFQNDINELFNILQVDFNIIDYVEKLPLPTNPDIKYDSLTEDIKAWLSSIYKVNMNDATLLEYDHDINMADFEKSHYCFIRDNTKKLYLVVYTTDNEKYVADLEAEANKYDFSTKFRLDFYNKYNNNK